MLQVSKTAQNPLIVFLQLRPLRLCNYGVYGASSTPGATVLSRQKFVWEKLVANDTGNCGMTFGKQIVRKINWFNP